MRESIGEFISPDSEIWEIQPIIAGGDPNDENNKVIVSRRKHIELVRWWNAKIAEHRAKTSQG
jgi:hypothetical protein